MATMYRLCQCCGDPGKYRNDMKRPLCDECYDELKYGTVPKIGPVHVGQGTANTEPAKHDALYHGGRFNIGEW